MNIFKSFSDVSNILFYIWLHKQLLPILPKPVWELIIIKMVEKNCLQTILRYLKSKQDVMVKVMTKNVFETCYLLPSSSGCVHNYKYLCSWNIEHNCLYANGYCIDIKDLTCKILPYSHLVHNIDYYGDIDPFTNRGTLLYHETYDYSKKEMIEKFTRAYVGRVQKKDIWYPVGHGITTIYKEY